MLIVAGLSVALFAPSGAMGAEHECAQCGVKTCCRPVCKCVPSTEEKKKLCFDCKCEDFCVPGPSCFCGHKSEAMDTPGDDCGCNKNCCISWNIWKPRCAEVRTRRVLIVHEVKKEVPTYKWEVEYLCESCRQCCAEAMPLRPETNGEVLPVSMETPIESPTEETVAPAKPGKKSWWAQLFSK